MIRSAASLRMILSIFVAVVALITAAPVHAVQFTIVTVADTPDTLPTSTLPTGSRAATSSTGSAR